MISLIISIIALGLIIMIHEMGHFLAAKACGVGVIEFSIGMGPRLLTKVSGDTRYSLRLLPFGGSCMMLGEEMDETSDDNDNAGARRAAELTNGTSEQSTVEYAGDRILVDGRSFGKEEQFVSKKAWQRFLIISAGPVFNFILAFLLSLVITGLYGFDKPVITNVVEKMPAAEAGIEADDEITALMTGGARMRVECARDISVFMTVHQDALERGDSFTIYYRDASDSMQSKAAELTPRYDAESKSNKLGFGYSFAYRPADGIADVIRCSFCNVKYCIRSVIQSLRMLAGGKVSREDVMGPVRMVAVMDETVDEASGYGAASMIITLFDLMILISGSLGAMNLLPLPALDGGRLVFILIELVTGHGVPKELEAKIHMAGMLLLLVLMCFILTNDITMLIFK
ncbi:MAG: site-2 protease family protein [Lachnospiraceae bacterium]|nr:site-2 protease family protein [Lachnospiraceae bacterium]